MEAFKRNYWLHRITGGENAWPIASPLLEKEKFISIGWSDFSEDSFAADVQSRGMDAIVDRYNHDGWDLSRNRWCLWRFIHEMKKGDYVIVPSWGKFSVYEIYDDNVLSNQSHDILFGKWGDEAPTYDGKYIYNKQGGYIDLGFYRKVKPIALDIPRSEYAGSKLVARMKNRKTNIDISDLEKEIERTLIAYWKKRPINLKANILKNITESTFKQIKSTLTPDKLEKLVGWYMKSLGAEWVITPAKNGSPTEQGDADREARFEKLKLIIMVQVKKHSGTTSEWAVQQIKAYKENNNRSDDYTTLLWVISTCDQFSEDAIALAKANGVRLINGREFTQLILESGLSGMDI